MVKLYYSHPYTYGEKDFCGAHCSTHDRHRTPVLLQNSSEARKTNASVARDCPSVIKVLI